ncbi:MAG: glycine cleavage system aminomethyltransferase GcvT [Polyangiales bacterium]
MTDANPHPTETLRRTSLFDNHKKAGGRMVPFAGWEMPVQYSGVSDEHKTVREAVGLFDVSHMGELEMSGEWAGHVVDYLVTNDVSKLHDGQAIYTCCCNEQGTILDDLIVYRAAADRFMIVCNASNRDKIAKVFRDAAKDHCTFVDRTDATALIALQGPKAWTVLAKAGDVKHLAALPAFHFAEANLFNVPCTVARTGYTGEDGVEIFCPWDAAPQLWEALLEIGKPEGIKPCGLGARDTLRLECKMALYGNDIDETTNPLEAGLAWTVKLDKERFVGKDALVRVKQDKPGRRLVGLEMTGRGIGRHGYPVKAPDGATVGLVTSGSPSPTLGKNIALAYVPVALAEVGTALRVDCRGKDVDAVVVKTPFYKRPGK